MELDLNLALQCVQALPHWLYALFSLAVPGVAAHLDAWIKQPSAGSLWLLIRKPLSVLAGNYGWAKNADQETLVEWRTANRAAFAAWLVSAAGNALKAELAKQVAATVPAQSDAAAAPEAPKEGE